MKKMVTDSNNIMGRYSAKTRDEMVAMMDDHISDLPEDQRASARFDIEEYGYAYDETTYFALFMKWDRPETDEEEAKREAEEAKHEGLRKARDLAEYTRLKAQFGGV